MIPRDPSIYTYFSSISCTMVDYIMIQSSLAFHSRACRIHNHHPLNLCDHLPVSLTIQMCTDSCASNQPNSTPNINWSRAVERGDIQLYVRAVSSIVSPLLSVPHQSIAELNDGISYVCSVLLEVSQEYLPTLSARKKFY